MGHTHRYKFDIKKNQVKSPSPESRTPNSIRIRQSGRAGNRGVTSYKLQEIVQLVSIGDKTNYAIYENRNFGTGAQYPHLFSSGKISRTKFILRGGEL